MKILVRLPNWLGDMVMSIGFINALEQVYPGAAISVIAKKGIHTLLEFFPATAHQFIFSKEEHPGITGAWRFGRMVRKKESFDLFFCLPESFSSALMGYATGTKERIGFEKELRSTMLTRSFQKRSFLHRVDEYNDLVRQYANKEIQPPAIILRAPDLEKENHIVVNINSEASSRRLPFKKAIGLLKALHNCSQTKLVLIGGKADVPFVDEVVQQLSATDNIINLTGKTSLPELVRQMAAARVVLTTDSGPAHVANALGTPTVVLFGAGNERNTAPYNTKDRTIIRLGKLPCEPCVKNTCVLYGIPQCLDQLDEQVIVESVLSYL